jgi:hypothetical protein
MRRRPIRRNGNGVSLSGPPIDPPSVWGDPNEMPYAGPLPTVDPVASAAMRAQYRQAAAEVKALVLLRSLWWGSPMWGSCRG